MDNHRLDNDNQIFFYENDFYVFSNFSSFTLEWKGLRFDTSEAVYHYEKFMHYEGAPISLLEKTRKLIHTAKSAHEAYRLAYLYRDLRRPDWNDVKVNVMRGILRAKVNQHEYVKKKLLASGDRELIEDSWRDNFWGWGPNRDGQNQLGKLWMEIRQEITV